MFRSNKRVLKHVGSGAGRMETSLYIAWLKSLILSNALRHGQSLYRKNLSYNSPALALCAKVSLLSKAKFTFRFHQIIKLHIRCIPWETARCPGWEGCRFSVTQKTETEGSSTGRFTCRMTIVYWSWTPHVDTISSVAPERNDSLIYVELRYVNITVTKRQEFGWKMIITQVAF